MATWKELERDKVYTNDNRSMYYKILDLTENYGVILCFEDSHKTASLKFIPSYNNDYIGDWREISEDDNDFVIIVNHYLDWLEFENEYTLKY